MHDYNTILGVIELRLSKVSYDSVQKRYRIGRSGIALIMNRYKDSGLSLDDLRQMPASKVVDLIYPKENLRHKDIPLPDFEKIHEQMIQMGKHADLSFLWIDYKKEHPNGYQLAQFYKLYRDFMVDTYGTSKTSMPVERIPGEKMYIDWVGDQPELLLDTTTGELRKVHIFTTTLGFSSLVYAEIFPDEKLPHFITGTVHALSYYGAVPKYLVPDNLRTAVTRHSKDELVLQSAFSDLETFYDTIILPPPPRKPKGKPTVENHVRFLETHLVEELKKDTYTSLEALNAAVKKIVADINQRPFQKKSDIRKSRMNGFEKYDKPRMNQLPGESYTLCDYKYFLKVPDNYHLEYDAHYSLKPDDRIFPVTKYYLNHEMERGCKACGVKKIRVHDLRHSHVSLLINMGYTALAIGKRVGHSAEKITYRYAHLFPSVQLDMAEQLDAENMKEEPNEMGGGLANVS